MNELELFAQRIAYAGVRLAPVIAMPAFSPLAWAPQTVRMVVLMAAALPMALLPAVAPMPATEEPLRFVLALAGEALVGVVVGLAVLVPQAALGFAGRVLDMQAGLSAGSVLNPGGMQESESLLGAALMMAATVLFFLLDLHHELLALLVASVDLIPLGAAGMVVSREALLPLMGAQFLLAFMVVAPVVLGLFVVEVGVAYATRSMPQANVYFLSLPLKIALAMALLAISLRWAPMLMQRLFEDVLARVPAVLGA